MSSVKIRVLRHHSSHNRVTGCHGHGLNGLPQISYLSYRMHIILWNDVWGTCSVMVSRNWMLVVYRPKACDHSIRRVHQGVLRTIPCLSGSTDVYTAVSGARLTMEGAVLDSLEFPPPPKRSNPHHQKRSNLPSFPTKSLTPPLLTWTKNTTPL